MTALVARHFEMEAIIVLGATNARSATRHENVAIAVRAGAELRYTKVAYNPALQRAVTAVAAEPAQAGWYRLPYAISTPDDADDTAIEAFHAVGAAQTANLPDTVTTMAIASGSANSTVSVLYGIAKTRPAALSRVVLLGVGPTRLEWMERRLRAIGRATGIDVAGTYRRDYRHHPDLQAAHQTDGPIVLEHHDLHATGWVTYQDRRPWATDGITFHPTYEGKAMEYLSTRYDDFGWWHRRDGTNLFWIVGSEPTAAAMAGQL